MNKSPKDGGGFSGSTSHPVPGNTYGGFAVDAPAAGRPEAPPPGAPAAVANPAPHTRPAGPAPLRGARKTAGWTIAAVVALGALAGLALTLARAPEPDAPPPVPLPEMRAAMARSAPDTAAAAPSLPSPARVAVAPAVPDLAPPPAARPAGPSAGRSPRSRCGQTPGAPGCPDRAGPALDQEVDAAFAAAMRASAEAGTLGAAQQAWIVHRDQTRRTDPGLAEDLDRARILELKALAARSEAPHDGGVDARD
jgi:hypothetical protein